MKSGSRSKGNDTQPGVQNPGTHPDWRTTDPSKAGRPGSVDTAPVPMNPVKEMRDNHDKLVEEK